MATQNWHTVLDALIPEEVLSDTVSHLMSNFNDPVATSIVSSERVYNKGWEQGWEVRKPVGGSLTGLVNMLGSNSTILNGVNADTIPRMHVQTSNPEDIDPLDAPKIRYAQKVMPLTSSEFLLPMNLSEMEQVSNPALVGDILPQIIKGFAANIVRSRYVLMYAENTSSQPTESTIAGVIARMPAAASIEYVGPVGASGCPVDFADFSTATDNADAVIFAPTNGAINRFAVGMIFDVHQPATLGLESAAPFGVPVGWNGRTGTRFYCVHVDPMLNRVVLVAREGFLDGGTGMGSPGGGSADATAATANVPNTAADFAHSYLFLPGGYNNSLWGIETWLRDRGRLWTSTGLSLADFPEYKSYFSAVDGPLTEFTLVDVFNRFGRAMDMNGVDVDTAIISPEASTKWAENYLPSFRRERGAGAYSVSDGVRTGNQFTTPMGKTINFQTSHYIGIDKCYIIKVGGGNIVRYAPPRPSEFATSAEGVDPQNHWELRYTAPALGYATPWVPITGAAGRKTRTTYLHGESVMQTIPESPAGIKLTGLSYTTRLADA